MLLVCRIKTDECPFCQYLEKMSSSKVKKRQALNPQQRAILISFYDRNQYPSASERQQLVQLTGRTLKQIQDWFSNHRVNSN